MKVLLDIKRKWFVIGNCTSCENKGKKDLNKIFVEYVELTLIIISKNEIF